MLQGRGVLGAKSQAAATAHSQQRGLRNHLTFARFAHAVALDRLGQDQGRLAGVLDRRRVGREHLLGVMAAAREAPDLVVAHVGDHRLQLVVLAEEMLAHVGAALALEVLVLAVDTLFHALEQDAALVLGEQLVPAAAPQHLDDVPAGAAEHALEFLDDLAVAAHRAVQALQIAIDDEDEVVQALARGQADRAQALGLVHLAVAHEGPDLALRGLGQAAALQVFQEARLVDRHQRPQAHRDGGELPEVGHQPGVRVGRQALARGLLPVTQQLLFGQPALDEGACVDAGRAMPLDEQQVAAVGLGRGVPEVAEADVVQRLRRLEAGDVAAEFGRVLVGAQDDRQCVPANDRAQAVLDGAVAGRLFFLFGGNGVLVGRRQRVRHVHAGAPRLLYQSVDDVVAARGSPVRLHGVEGVEPLAGLAEVDVVV
mmetsp:Transcript_4939/g.17780  ORF Transcript_4939/g.17780 Transcript_4939/m.17780 type:complete len:427 (-) Transcript_4939:721-2001(-)